MFRQKTVKRKEVRMKIAKPGTDLGTGRFEKYHQRRGRLARQVLHFKVELSAVEKFESGLQSLCLPGLSG
jgi:hypothetical protein